MPLVTQVGVIQTNVTNLVNAQPDIPLKIKLYWN